MELQMKLELGDIDDDEYVRARGRAHGAPARSARVARAARQGDERRTGARRARHRPRSERARRAARSSSAHSLIVGKGGVGKTTCAAAHRRDVRAARRANAARLDRSGRGARRRARRAGRRRDAAPVAGAAAVSTRDNSSARQLRDEFLAQWRDTIAEIVDRGTYLDRADVDGSSTRRCPASTRSSRCSRSPTCSPTTRVAYDAHRRRHRADRSHAAPARAARDVSRARRDARR